MIAGLLNTEWVVAMIKQHGPLSMPELRALRAGPESDGTDRSMSCAINELMTAGIVTKGPGNRWALVAKMGWRGVFASMTKRTS